MSDRAVYWGLVAALCWLVALYLVLAPVGVQGADCGLPVADALDRTSDCAEVAAGRVGRLAAWLVVTGGVTTGFLAACATGRGTPEE